jgi:hypothetical protein
MTRFEILIELNGVRHQLDTDGIEPISLTYNVADVADISKRDSSFSKTIKIPETKKNRIIFGDISDLGVDSSFNPNKKTKAFILVDTIVIFEGYLQLRRVFVDKDENKTYYEVVIYADNDTFFSNLGEKYLTDMDFSELNHIWSENNILKSWTASNTNGWYYPLIDYGKDWSIGSIGANSNGLGIGDLLPATNIKYIWDKIFNDSGWTYESDFINSEIFSDLYSPFNKGVMKRDLNTTPYRFSVGLTQSYGMTTSVNVTVPRQVSQTGVVETSYISIGTWKIPFNSETSPNGDPDGVWNETIYEYIAPSEFIAQNFVCNFDINFEFLTDYNLSDTKIRFMRSRNPSTGATVSPGATNPNGGWGVPINNNINGTKFSTIPGLVYSDGGKRVKGQVSTNVIDGSSLITTKLWPGEKLWVEVSFGIRNDKLKDQYSNTPRNYTKAVVNPEWGAISNTHAVYDTLDGQKDLWLVNLQTGFASKIADDIGYNDLMYDTDGDFVVYQNTTSTNVRQLRLFRISTGVVTIIDTQSGGFGWDFVSIEGDWILFYNNGTTDKKMVRYRISTGQSTTISLGSGSFGPQASTMHRKGDWAIWYNADTDIYYSYRISTGTLSNIYSFNGTITKTAFNGTHAVWFNGSSLRVYNVQTSTVIATIAITNITSYSISNNYYVYQDASTNLLKYINLTTGGVTSTGGAYNIQNNKLTNNDDWIVFHAGSTWVRYYRPTNTFTTFDNDNSGGSLPIINQFNIVVYLNRQTNKIREFSLTTGMFFDIATGSTLRKGLINDNGVFLLVSSGNIDYVNVWSGSIGILPGDTFPWTLPAGTKILTFNSPNLIFNILKEVVLPNETITYNSAIPEKIKQKDFITSIIKMFNLYIEPSKDYEKHFIIEPRDDYYASGKIKNWSRLLDISDDIEEQILGETQNKTTIFKYKDDKDYYNTDYKDIKGGFSYGQYENILDNDFIKGEKKIELIFSPTPGVLLTGSEQFVIPKIGKITNNLFSASEFNMRILTRFRSSTDLTWTYNTYISYNDVGGQWNGFTQLTTDSAYGPFTNDTHTFLEGDWINISQVDGGLIKPQLNNSFKIVKIIDSKNIVINIDFSAVGSGPAIDGVVTPLNGMLPVLSSNDNWKFNGKIYAAYPYLGHLDNPQSPHYDLNFGQTIGLYYPETTVTNDNLYSVYWSNFMGELSDKDSRIITASFNLGPDDIANFRFNDNIFIGDQYYKVNKIQNYDPTVSKTCRVELIKTKFISIPRAFRKRRTNFPTYPAVPDGPEVTWRASTKPDGPINILNTGRNNLITQPNTAVIGDNNLINSNRSLIIGDDNITSTDRVMINGSGNEVYDENVVVFGDNNIINQGAAGSIIFGSNQTISAPNTFVMGGVLVITSNEVSAGRNEILNPFPGNKIINYISASRNEVRELGSQDVVNFIDAGRYEV